LLALDREDQHAVTIQAIILDIGGVLEITPDPQMTRLIERWGKRLQLKPGDLAERRSPFR
jgi:hypothetical protein